MSYNDYDLLSYDAPSYNLDMSNIPDCYELIPDPQAVQDVINAHREHSPGEPLILPMSLYAYSEPEYA